MLSKLAATLGQISAGAIASRYQTGPSENVEESAPEIVDDLLNLVVECLCIGSKADPNSLVDVKSFLLALIERYGNLRLSVDALASGMRRHPAVSHEKAHGWSIVLNSSVSQIEQSIKKTPALAMQISRWIAIHGESLESRLDAYQRWLDRPIEVDGWQARLRAACGSPAPSEGDTIHEYPSTDGEIDAETVRRVLLDDKPLHDFQGSSSHGLHGIQEYKSLCERMVIGADLKQRVIGAIALRKFKVADESLPQLRGRVPQAEFWRLLGDRSFFDGRYDDAVEAYRSAKTERDDPLTRRNLAAALLRSRRTPIDAQTKEAIDLLAHSLGLGGVDPPMAGRIEALLGAAWLMHPAGDRDANVRRAIEHLELSLERFDPQNDSDWWAHVHVELGAAWLALPSGKKIENVQRAMTCFDRAAGVWTREFQPERWASIQNHLGHAWERLPSGDRGGNLRRAIACFEAAMEVRTRADNPVGWAMIQNNLGNVWVQMPGDDHHGNILRAIEHHMAALDVWSNQNRRGEWAASQSNLGNAWALLPAEGEAREKNLRRAIAAYKGALEVRTRAAYPVEWATTQNNLGSALLLLPSATQATILEAVAYFQHALEVRTRDVFPIDWAKTQANLGNAWLKIPARGRERREYLEKARECYAQALIVFTRGSHPQAHDHIMSKKAEVMDKLDELQLTS